MTAVGTRRSVDAHQAAAASRGVDDAALFEGGVVPSLESGGVLAARALAPRVGAEPGCGVFGEGESSGGCAGEVELVVERDDVEVGVPVGGAGGGLFGSAEPGVDLLEGRRPEASGPRISHHGLDPGEEQGSLIPDSLLRATGQVHERRDETPRGLSWLVGHPSQGYGPFVRCDARGSTLRLVVSSSGLWGSKWLSHRNFPRWAPKCRSALREQYQH